MSHLVISNRKIKNATYFKDPSELTVFLEKEENGHLEVLIFAFWSWIVPPWILDSYKCYGFHTGPLLEGKGRGGSPIDNLIKLGVNFTTLCVFKMNEVIDGGQVVLAIPVSLTQGKDFLIGWIDGFLPRIVDYLTEDRPEIPEKFRRLQDAK